MMGHKADKFNNVYVKNISDDLDDDGLREMFERFGKVLSPKVMRTSDGKSCGFGFVSFEEPEAAEKAVVEMNGKRQGDKVLIACPAKKKAERQAELNEHAKKKAERQAELERKLKCKFTNRYEGVNLYVKNLDDVIDDEHLHKEFSQFGTITSAKVMRTSDGRSLGFGFVNFKEPESAEKAVEQMSGKKLGDKVLYVCPAKNKAERQVELKELAQKKAERQAELEKKLKGKKLEFTNHYDGVNLYVKYLDDVIDEKRLRKEFSQFGTITSAKVITEKGRAKGYGFVCFSSPEEAQKAISEMNGRILEGKPLHVAIAQSKEERMAHLASQRQLSSKKMQKKQAASRTVELRSGETLYRQLLQELAGDLTSDDVSQLVFLLMFHPKAQKIRSDMQLHATELLAELEKLNCIGVDNLTLLVELFELIGCTDLINRIVEKLGHSCQVSKHEVNEYMRILWTFGQKLDLDDLNNAKCILDWTQEKENIEKVWQLFEKAFKRGLLEQDNFGMLERFAESIKQRDKLNSVMNQDPGCHNSEVIGAGDSIKRHEVADPGNVSACGTIQVEYLYRRARMKDQQEEMPALVHQYPDQNTLDKSKEEKTIQKKAVDVGETYSSSGDLNWTLKQAVQSKTEFKGPTDLTLVTSVTTVDQISEQASIRVEQKEVQQELDHTEAKTVRKMTDTVHSHNDLNMTSGPGIQTDPNPNLNRMTRGPGVQTELKEFSAKLQHVDTRFEQVSRKSEEKEEIQDIKDAKNRRKTAIKGHSPDDINFTLEQPVQTKTGDFTVYQKQFTSNIDPRSEQETIGRPLCDNSNVKDERECQSSSTKGTSANFGAIRLQELVDESVPGSRSPEQSQRLQESGVSQTTETKYDTFSTTRRLEVCLTKNPRRGRIMVLTVEEMKSYIREKIGSGAFGDVYKAKMSGSNFEFAIKEIRVKTEYQWKTYEKEIHSGRILHPFINPIIARAEKPPSKSEEGVSYLMYPYMQNKDLRQNIDREKTGIKLSKESNSKIWTRCIYQIAQAVDYLHKPVTSIRGAVFHRDLSSRNIFLDQDFNVKIGDFGVALEAKGNAQHATVTRTMGTEGYHPPNMNQYKYDASYDVFSVGVVMLEILTGEEAILVEDGSYLHEKYRNKGYEYLIDQLDQRVEEPENEAARWPHKKHRNKLAEIALRMVSSDETQRKMDNLLQELDDMRLDSGHRYRKPTSQDRCVSCYVNPPAMLSLKGVHCGNIESPCLYFCRHCLMTNDINPLVCPQHGKTRPPFGDHVYGVFVAGNNVEGMPQFSYEDEPSKIAQVFIRDVEKVVDVLTAKHPFVLGASTECLKVVKPNNPGTKEEMGKHIENAFEEISLMIKESKKNMIERKVQKNEQEGGGRLPDSLFIFYFSGHCSKDDGLYLGNAKETLKASTKWIKEMLHLKLCVDHVLVILDCCHADSQNFTDSQGLNSTTCSTKEEKVRIHQLSSCDTNQKSIIPCVGKDEGHCSLYTDIMCKGLQGLNSRTVGENAIFCCDKCEIQRGNEENMDMKLPCVKYHLRCDSDHAVTLTALKDFILGHFDLPVSDTDGTKYMSPTSSSQREKQLFLTYYNQDKLHISIHLKGIPECFMFSSLPGTIDGLKQDIIDHAVKQNVECDVLLFHQNYTQNSSQLIAIYPKYGRDKDEELTTLSCIYRAWRSNCELEARVRDTLKGLLNGPIKISMIKKSMITLHEASFNEDYLKISQNHLEMVIKCKKEAENQIKDFKKNASPTQLKEFRKFLLEILNVTQNIPSSILEKKHDKVLKFYFYDDFSVLNIE